MGSLNVVMLMGNLTADVELRNAGSTVVTTLRMAVSDSHVAKDGKRVESTVFVDVEVWGKQAESCQKYLSKGSPLMVEGKLKFDQWQTKEGEKRNKLSVRADRVQFLGSRQSDDGGGVHGGKGGSGYGGGKSDGSTRGTVPADDISFPGDAEPDPPF